MKKKDWKLYCKDLEQENSWINEELKQAYQLIEKYQHRLEIINRMFLKDRK